MGRPVAEFKQRSSQYHMRADSFFRDLRILQAGMGNVLLPGLVKPANSFALALPRKPQSRLEIQ